MTFSIAAWDPSANPSPEWGVAVASKFLACAAVVPWARAGAGAIATQALANVAYGPAGLERLARGEDAASVVAALTEADELRDDRQVGIVDARGRAAHFTGARCLDWAGGIGGDGYCCQGNILTGPDVLQAMARAFESTEGELAVRLLAALKAGDAAGGDRRGRQAAGILVVRDGGGYGGGTDKTVDLRVDDHPGPTDELLRIFDIHRLLFPRPEDLDYVDVDGALAERLRAALTGLGYDAGSGAGYDGALKRALLEFVGTENLEERWSDEDKVDRGVLAHLWALSVRPGAARG